MLKGVIFDLGGTLMYFEGRWEEIDKQSTAALIAFLRENEIQVGDDFHARFLAQRQAAWKLAEQTRIEHTVEEALGKTLAEPGYASKSSRGRASASGEARFDSGPKDADDDARGEIPFEHESIDARDDSRQSDGLLPRAVQVYFALGEQHWHAYPDAIETLQALRQRGLHVGLISNADDDGLVQRLVKRLGFAPYLNPVISSAGVKWRKPDSRIFLRVAEEWQLPPDEIAMVGDIPAADILGAHRAGMRGILIDRGDNAGWQKIPDELANDPAVNPDVTVSALAEIPALIERL